MRKLQTICWISVQPAIRPVPKWCSAGRCKSTNAENPSGGLSVNDLLRVGWKNALSGQGYSSRFHAYRKNIHRFMGTRAVLSRFIPLLDLEARRFLFRTLEKPEKFRDYIRVLVSQLSQALRYRKRKLTIIYREAGAVILKIVYAYTIEPLEQDPFVELADNALKNFSLATVPGAWTVDTIPFCQLSIQLPLL